MAWKVLEIERFYAAVEDLDKAEALFRDAFGGKLSPGRVPQLEESNAGAIARIVNFGNTRIELYQSVGDDWIGKLTKEKAPGWFAIELRVDNLDEAIKDLRAKGLRVTNPLDVPVTGKGAETEHEYMKEAVVWPQSCLGLLIYLQEGKLKPGVEETLW